MSHLLHDRSSPYAWQVACQASLKASRRRRRKAANRYYLTTALMGLAAVGAALALYLVLS